MQNHWLLTAAILVGSHIAFIGYMFWVVSELSASGWWFVFSTVLPCAFLSAAAIGSFAFPAIGIPLAIAAFFLRKRWWQVLVILTLSVAGAFLQREPSLIWVSVAIFVIVHVSFAILRGREAFSSLATGSILMVVGGALLTLGAAV